MAKKNKYIYAWVIQGYWGYWEDVSYYDKKEYTWQDVKYDYREYIASGTGSYRIINRRELNTREDQTKS